MIARISGKVLDKDLTSLVVEAGGVGYRVAVTGKVIQSSRSKIGKEISLFTHLAIRENAHDLYGFDDRSDLEMFELLLTISGIGPKSAIAIMNTASASTLIEGIQSGDAAYLSKMTGIGRKTAEKIVVNLKDEVGLPDVDATTAGTQNKTTVAIDALVALGYSERESRQAVAGIKADDPEKMIREALKKVGGQ